MRESRTTRNTGLADIRNHARAQSDQWEGENPRHRPQCRKWEPQKWNEKGEATEKEPPTEDAVPPEVQLPQQPVVAITPAQKIANLANTSIFIEFSMVCIDFLGFEGTIVRPKAL